MFDFILKNLINSLISSLKKISAWGEGRSGKLDCFRKETPYPLPASCNRGKVIGRAGHADFALENFQQDFGALGTMQALNACHQAFERSAHKLDGLARLQGMRRLFGELARNHRRAKIGNEGVSNGSGLPEIIQDGNDANGLADLKEIPARAKAHKQIAREKRPLDLHAFMPAPRPARAHGEKGFIASPLKPFHDLEFVLRFDIGDKPGRVLFHFSSNVSENAKSWEDRQSAGGSREHHGRINVFISYWFIVIF
nr:hypothetical protein [Beijerinckia mobilis]